MNLGGSIRLKPVAIAMLAFFAVAFIYLSLGPGSVEKELNSETIIKTWHERSQAKSEERKSEGDESKMSLKALLCVAIEVAMRGGREVKKIREQADIGEKSKGKTLEGVNNPVTDGDMLSHHAMFYGLKKAFPLVNVISEEHDDDGDGEQASVDMASIPMPDMVRPEVQDVIGSKDEHVAIDDIDVWIDPLDATKEYTENLLHYVTTMVCVAIRGIPVIGVIHKPFEDRTAWGWNYLDHSFVSTTVEQDVNEGKNRGERENEDHHRIIVSRSHAGEVHDVAERAFGINANVTPAGGAGFKSWEVIKGAQDAYVHVTLIKKWDICAGNAVLNAVGGRMTTLDGRTIDYSGKPAHPENKDGVLATMMNHDEYLEALKTAVKPRRK